MSAPGGWERFKESAFDMLVIAVGAFALLGVPQLIQELFL